MPVRKETTETDGFNSALRVSGLFLRRKSDREFHSYIPFLEYHPGDYEVLLRAWGSEPFSRHLGAFSGPIIAGEDPEETLLTKSKDWTKNLANRAGVSNYKPLQCHKALYLSTHGGGKQVDPVTGKIIDIGIVLTYIVPTKQSDSSLISKFPSLFEYPKFYNFGNLLHQMVRSSIEIHPYTREMLSALDHWLREQHAISGGINTLFAPSLHSRMKMFVMNPLHAPPPHQSSPLETPNQSFLEESRAPLISSTPFNGVGGDSTLYNTTAITVSRVEQSNVTVRGRQPVDMLVKNPLFGSGLKLKKVDLIAVNEYFGSGEPDYTALGTSDNNGKWMVQVQGTGLPDWTELFPLHKLSCEGNVEGVRRCVQSGISADERDTDTWSPLHYACWYGELQVVKVLVEEASATIGIQNSSGSTPFHLAAGTGHVTVVSYLLKQRGGQRVKAALDNDGKSPLAVCLECKMNDWVTTAEILREAYKNPTPADLSFPPPLLPYSPPPSSMEDLSILSSSQLSHVREAQGDLGLKGSLGDIYGATNTTTTTNNTKSPKQKSKLKGGKPARTVRRQRVNLGIGQHQVAHFFNGRDTSCKDVLMNLYRLMKLPENFHNLFSLWISSNSLELQLGDTDQPLKIMYSWKKLLSQYGGKGEGEIPTFHLRRNVFSPPSGEKMITDPMVLEFLYADAHRKIINAQYPCSDEDVFYLSGITLQITYGDYNEAVVGSGYIKDKLNKVLPSHMISSKKKVELERKVLAKYAEISQFGFEDLKFLYQTYLKHCWQWPYYGATFYDGILHTKGAKFEGKGKMPRKSHIPVSIGINTDGFYIISPEANALLAAISFDGLDWDVSPAKQELVVFNKDQTVYISISSKKAPLLYGLATRMREQYTEIA